MAFKKRRREKSYRECSQPAVDRYSGKKSPYCNGGRGCRACWAKYLRVNNKVDHALRAA